MIHHEEKKTKFQNDMLMGKKMNIFFFLNLIFLFDRHERAHPPKGLYSIKNIIIRLKLNFKIKIYSIKILIKCALKTKLCTFFFLQILNFSAYF